MAGSQRTGVAAQNRALQPPCQTVRLNVEQATRAGVWFATMSSENTVDALGLKTICVFRTAVSPAV